MEMRKALKNKWFWGMLLLGLKCYTKVVTEVANEI